MAESSARGKAGMPKSGGNSLSSSIAADKGGTRPRHRDRLKSWLLKTSNPSSLETPSTSRLNARLLAENDSADERIAHGLSSTGSASGKKPEASYDTRGDPSIAQPSHSSSPCDGKTFAETGGDYEAAVPIAELWNHAYEQLREKEPRLIKKYEAEISLHVSTMVGTTVAISGLGKVRRREQMEVLVKQKLEEDEAGKWRIPLGDDRVAFRDLAGYVVSIVAWGQEFVGSALESSPYGSIAWAGVCLLLPLILNPSKQRASNISGLEYISDLLGRCAMYEYAYRERYEINRDELDLDSDGYKSALKELYLRILKFQAESVCQFSRSLVHAGVRAMFKMDDWDALLGDIKLQEAKCQTIFDSVKDQAALYAREEGHRQRTSLLLNKLEELNMGLRDKLEEIHFSNEESSCFEILRTCNYVARKDLNPERLPGTCKWFLDHQKYQGWIAQRLTSRLLWVTADPGCGKSVLAKTLVDQYDRDSVCYFFFKDDTTITRSAAHAICAILHQICDSCPVLIKHILPMYRKNGAKLVDLFEDLWSAFAIIINDKDFENVICILDAIDECSDNDQRKLLQRLAAIAISSTSIKILITSRPYTSIETALFHNTGLDKIEIRLSGEAPAEQSMIEKEIGFFITSRVQEFQKLRESNGIHDHAHKKLQSHLDGVKNRSYLWVSAVFNELERDIYAPEYILLETINSLPENVHKAYENILEKSPKKLILKKVLHIVLAAFRPLFIMEMKAILAIQDTASGPRYSDLYPTNSFSIWLRNLCGFFINIVDNKIYFAHQTAREFLVGEEGYQATKGWRGSFQLTDSHTLIAQICIDYLLLLYGGSREATFETYATNFWPLHCQSLEMDQSLADRVKKFLFQSSSVAPSFIRWAKVIRDCKNDYNSNWHLIDDKIMSSVNSPPTPLFLACNFGWPSVIHVLKSCSGIDWNQKTKSALTGLHIAVQKGHLETVKLLLTAGADTSVQDNWGEPVLHSAVSEGHLEAVELLLTAGADVNFQGHVKRSALHLAALTGHLEIIKLLLTSRADISVQDNWGETVLHLAVLEGHLEAVELLLTAGADVNIQDHVQRSALHLAVWKGHLEIIKLLLTAGADFNLKNNRGETVLLRAVDEAHLEIVKLLLTARVDINVEDSWEKSALYHAALSGHLEIVKLLLTAAADINVGDKWEQTALHHAVDNDHFEIVKLLLTAGVDINVRDKWGGTALHRAASKGHLETVELLLTAGADVNIQDNLKRTALHLAVLKGKFKIVKLLMTAGADINVGDKWGQTALHHAASGGHLKNLKLLLKAGADVNIQDDLKSTALHYAIDEDHLEIVEFLMMAGADINVGDKWGITALHHAVSSGRFKIVRLFLTKGVDFNIGGYQGNTALHRAASNCHLKIVKLLLTAGADINVRDTRGQTALHLAFWGENLEIVKLLLTADADITVRDDEGKMALHLAVFGGHLEIVKLLITAGADINVRDTRGQTALHDAASHGRLEIVELLWTAGADVNIQNDLKSTALHYAIDEDHLEIVEFLMMAGADINVGDKWGITALHHAASSGRFEIVRLLLTKGVDFNIGGYQGNTALHRAASNCHLKIVKLLLTAGADVNIQDDMKRTALHYAVDEGHLEIVEFLLTAGADINIQDNLKRTALHFAVSEGHLEIVKLLLTAGADINVEDKLGGKTALHCASSKGHLEIVELSLTAGADINVGDKWGQTALHRASSKGHLEIVELLLMAGAEVNIQNDLKRTALHYAVHKGHLEIVKLLLTAGLTSTWKAMQERRCI